MISDGLFVVTVGLAEIKAKLTLGCETSLKSRRS